MRTVVIVSMLVASLTGIRQSGQQTFTPDAEGFIRNWLILAPIVVQEDAGAVEIEHDFLNGEGSIKPRPGQTVKIGGGDLTWQVHQTADYFIDFRESFGQVRGEDAAGYAVAYILADDAMKVTLLMGSNDQGRVWLNGQTVLTFSDTRTLSKDSDRADVTLAKGQNVLVFKVVNEKNNWQGCIRFLKDGVPVKSIKVSLTPQ